MRRFMILVVFGGAVIAVSCAGRKTAPQPLTGNFFASDTVGNSVVTDCLVVKGTGSEPYGIYRIELHSKVHYLKPGMTDRVKLRQWDGVWEEEQNVLKTQPTGTNFIFDNERNAVTFDKTEFIRK